MRLTNQACDGARLLELIRDLVTAYRGSISKCSSDAAQLSASGMAQQALMPDQAVTCQPDPR